MVKIIDSMKLDTSKLRDLAGSLKVLESKCMSVVPKVGALAKPIIRGQAVINMEYRTEGGVSALERELAELQAALRDARSRIRPALKTLKRSLS